MTEATKLPTADEALAKIQNRPLHEVTVCDLLDAFLAHMLTTGQCGAGMRLSLNGQRCTLVFHLDHDDVDAIGFRRVPASDKGQ